VLAEGPLTGRQIEERLGLHPRPIYDFLDGLVALHFLERDGDGPDVHYRNTPDTAAAGLSDRVKAGSGDFFVDPLPSADVITMSRILHEWNLDKRMHLIRAAYGALPVGGAFIVVESLIDDGRRENVNGLMMSLKMLIEFGDAFDYSAADFAGWCREVGFRDIAVLPLTGIISAAVAYK
jgi:hypothetical protein